MEWTECIWRGEQEHTERCWPNFFQYSTGYCPEFFFPLMLVLFVKSSTPLRRETNHSICSMAKKTWKRTHKDELWNKYGSAAAAQQTLCRSCKIGCTKGYSVCQFLIRLIKYDSDCEPYCTLAVCTLFRNLVWLMWNGCKSIAKNIDKQPRFLRLLFWISCSYGD